MVKRRKALKGAKGSALFMVICVMAILMVVAITAMAMVSLAYTRSLQNYTASQSYVTAINTLDMIVAATDTVNGSNDYGQSAYAGDPANGVDPDYVTQKAIAQPLMDAMNACDVAIRSGGTAGDDGQEGYGTVDFSGVEEMEAIQFLDFTDASGASLGNIKYEILPDPDPAGSHKTGHEIANDGAHATDVYYGKWAYKEDINRGGHDYKSYYAFARMKITVKVKSGSGDTAQIRTVSRITDANLYYIDKRTTSSPGSNDDPVVNNGKFTQAVKTMGLYTSGTGMNVIGGLSSYGGGGSFAGLKGNTSSVYINGDFDPIDSGHNGTMDISGGQQITINGKFSVNNNFKFNSLYTGDDVSSTPFLYCEEIEWKNSDIPTGKMDILTKNGGIYGRDGNKIEGNVLSGGDLTLVGNNLDISGTIFVDGDVNIQNSIKGTGTIYTTGNVIGSNSGVKVVQLPADTEFDIQNPKIDADTGSLIVTTPTTPSATYKVSTDKSVFGSYFIDGDPDNGVITAETRPDTVDYEILANSTGVIEIETTADAVTTLYLPAGDYTNMEIVVKGGGDVKIYQDGDVNMTSCKIWSEFVKEKVENGETIDMKTLANDPDYSIIEWEVAEDAKINVGHTGGEGCFFNTYIYGPDAGIMQTASGTPGRPEITVIDEFGRTQTIKTWLMGAVVGNDITMVDGGPGIVFIDPDGTGTGGSGGGGGSGSDPTPPGAYTLTGVRVDLSAASSTGYGIYTNR